MFILLGFVREIILREHRKKRKGETYKMGKEGTRVAHRCNTELAGCGQLSQAVLEKVLDALTPILSSSSGLSVSSCKSASGSSHMFSPRTGWHQDNGKLKLARFLHQMMLR